MLLKLLEHEPMAAAQRHRMKYEVINFGIALHECCADWYGRLAKGLETGKESKT
jgi:hypothetical protein